MAESTLDRLSDLDREHRDRLLAEIAERHGLTVAQAKAKLLGSWRATARPEQLEPPGQWRTWYCQGGRGSGKTRTGAETLAGWIRRTAAGEWAVVAPTFGDGRDVCVESKGGLLQALGEEVLVWNRSMGQILLRNGSKVFVDGADDGALRIQGKNLRGAWCDEVGLWKPHGWQRAWEESLQFAVRLDPGRIVATGTPKAGHPLVRLLLDGAASGSTHVTRMRTLDNAGNLDPVALRQILSLYQGRKLGRQELEGEFIEDVEGALWTHAMIDGLRVLEAPPLNRIVVAVDPNVSSGATADAAGIVVAGIAMADSNPHGYVLADRTVVKGGPRAWSVAAVRAYEEWEADRIVAEANNGGEMVELVIHSVDPTVPVKIVRASTGKRARAEPVAALYEGDEATPGRVHHVGVFPDLEDEMATWAGDLPSPNRMDALVWAITELKLWKEPPRPVRTYVARRRIPTAADRFQT